MHSYAVAPLACAVFLASIGSSARADDVGRVSVVSVPRGELIVDGQPTGQMTPVASFAVPSGSHTIGARPASGDAPPTQRVLVRSNATTHVYLHVAAARADACAQGSEAECWRLVDQALRAHDTPHARAYLRAFLRTFPESEYAFVARTTLNALDHPPAPAHRFTPSTIRSLVRAVGALALIVAVAWIWRRNKARSR